MNDDPILHIYGQHFWHGSAHIVGNRAALTLLRAALDRALGVSYDNSQEFEAQVIDGEGYALTVLCTDDQAAWDKMRLPYTDEEVFEAL